MWMPRANGGEKKEGRNYGLTAVAIDRDKGSQNAIKWAIDNILQKGQTLILIHVKLKPSAAFSLSPSLPSPSKSLESFQTKYITCTTRKAKTKKNEMSVGCMDI